MSRDKGYELAGRAHAEVVHRASRTAAAARREEGQGTVEYVALLLLLGAIFAAVVGFTGKGKLGGDIASTIGDQVKAAIGQVTKQGGK